MEKELGDYKGIWALGEVREGKIHPVSYELLAWGRGLADNLGVELSSVIIGHNIEDKVKELIFRGADKVYLVDNPSLEHFRADPYSKILTALVEEYRPEVFIASATTMGRTVMPICAVKLEAGLTADCTGLDIDLDERLLIQTRPAVGGNIMATIKTPDMRPQMSTVRPKSKRPLPMDNSRTGEVIVKEFKGEYLDSRVKRIDFQREESLGAPIQGVEIADCVVNLVGGGVLPPHDPGVAACGDRDTRRAGRVARDNGDGAGPALPGVVDVSHAVGRRAGQIDRLDVTGRGIDFQIGRIRGGMQTGEQNDQAEQHAGRRPSTESGHGFPLGLKSVVAS